MQLRFSKQIRLALCVPLAVAATAASADPFSLVAGCGLTSIVAGQGKCVLEAEVTDLNFSSPAAVKKVQIKVNNILVLQGNNDATNPRTGFTDFAVTSVGVACGGTYYPTGYILRQDATTYERVGNVPGVVCPTAT